MTEEQWEETIDRIKKNFDVEEELDGDIENIPRATYQGIIFDSPHGKMKVIRNKRPKVLDKKTTYSRRAGGETSVDYVYSDDEYVDEVEVSKWDDYEQDWVKAEYAV
jgi:hypothetical protein